MLANRRISGIADLPSNNRVGFNSRSRVGTSQDAQSGDQSVHIESDLFNGVTLADTRRLLANERLSDYDTGLNRGARELSKRFRTAVNIGTLNN